MIDKAFILAAGLGKRMRPLTDVIPKPMVQVVGKTLIDRTLNQLQQFGINEVVVNTHYKADVLKNHLQNHSKPKVIISHEPDLLDTAGGIKKALPLLGNKPFFVLSGDGLWQDNPAAPALKTLALKWDPLKMDILILLQPVSSMKLTQGIGDYDLDKEGRAIRSKTKKGAYMFTSMRINSPVIFKNTPEGAFSYLELLDRAESQGRLFGIIHQGNWHHISTPKDVETLNTHRGGT